MVNWNSSERSDHQWIERQQWALNCIRVIYSSLCYWKNTCAVISLVMRTLFFHRFALGKCHQRFSTCMLLPVTSFEHPAHMHHTLVYIWTCHSGSMMVIQQLYCVSVPQRHLHHTALSGALIAVVIGSLFIKRRHAQRESLNDRPVSAPGIPNGCCLFPTANRMIIGRVIYVHPSLWQNVAGRNLDLFAHAAFL